jgi:uncharacterized protein (DUF433 family)
VEPLGAYAADRAAALSAVPKSTVYAWARSGVLVPSVSSSKVRLWSYADLMGLRVIYWLRQPKTQNDGADIPATSMPMVRRALVALRAMELPLWSSGQRPSIVVDRGGNVYVDGSLGYQTPAGQTVFSDLLNPIAPFDTVDNTHGPDLIQPRPSVRIHPGRLAGSPHILNTRIETIALSALRDAGYSETKISALYPHITREQIGESLDLESQLKVNLSRAA